MISQAITIICSAVIALDQARRFWHAPQSGERRWPRDFLTMPVVHLRARSTEQAAGAPVAKTSVLRRRGRLSGKEGNRYEAGVKPACAPIIARIKGELR